MTGHLIERNLQVPPCCDVMAAQLEPCETHPDPLECGDKAIVRTRTGLGLPIDPEAGGGFYEVTHCPFCGRRVPAPLGELEELYKQARGAVLGGAVMVGPEPDGVTKDEALEYAAELIRRLAPLFVEAGGELVRLAPGQVVASRDLLDSLVSGDDQCDLDHWGACQAHGYLSLEHGEVCPQAELQALLRSTS